MVSAAVEVSLVLKVGDFSRLGHVTVRALRLYDDLGLLKPARVDPQSGYRYYALEQLPRLNQILALKDLGLDLAQIQRWLKRPVTAEVLQEMLRTKQAELEQELDRTRVQLERISLRLRQLEQEGRPQPCSFSDVHVKPLSARTVASIRSTVPRVEEVGATCTAHFSLLGRWFCEAGLTMGGTLNLYHNDEYRDEQIELESAAVLEHRPFVPPPPGVEIRALEPVPRAAVLTLETRLSEVPLAITSLLSWVGQSGLTPCGPLREVHHFGDRSRISRDERMVVELQLPVEQL